MKLNPIAGYRRTTEMEADAMINEGGAVGQPSRDSSVQAFSELVGGPCPQASIWRHVIQNPKIMFWAGFATGLTFSLLNKRRDADV